MSKSIFCDDHDCVWGVQSLLVCYSNFRLENWSFWTAKCWLTWSDKCDCCIQHYSVFCQLYQYDFCKCNWNPARITVQILRFLKTSSNSKRKTFFTKRSRKFYQKTYKPQREVKKSISKKLKSNLRKRKIGKKEKKNC